MGRKVIQYLPPHPGAYVLTVDVSVIAAQVDRKSRLHSRIIEEDYFSSREASQTRLPSDSNRATPRGPSPSPSTPYLQAISSNFSQILPFSNSLLSNNSFGNRNRHSSEISLGADGDVADRRASGASILPSMRRADRSASPIARESFRQQLFGRPSASYSPNIGSPAFGSMRSGPSDPNMSSSHSTSGPRVNRVSFSPSLQPVTARRSASRHGSVSTPARTQSTVKSWQIRIDAECTAASEL